MLAPGRAEGTTTTMLKMINIDVLRNQNNNDHSQRHNHNLPVTIYQTKKKWCENTPAQQDPLNLTNIDTTQIMTGDTQAEPRVQSLCQSTSGIQTTPLPIQRTMH